MSLRTSSDQAWTPLDPQRTPEHMRSDIQALKDFFGEDAPAIQAFTTPVSGKLRAWTMNRIRFDPDAPEPKVAAARGRIEALYEGRPPPKLIPGLESEDGANGQVLVRVIKAAQGISL